MRVNSAFCNHDMFARRPNNEHRTPLLLLATLHPTFQRCSPDEYQYILKCEARSTFAMPPNYHVALDTSLISPSPHFFAEKPWRYLAIIFNINMYCLRSHGLIILSMCNLRA